MRKTKQKGKKEGGMSEQDEKGSISPPSPATLLLLFLLFDLQLSCFLNLLFCLLHFFWDRSFSFLFLYSLQKDEHLRCGFKHSYCDLHFPKGKKTPLYLTRGTDRKRLQRRHMFTFVFTLDLFFWASASLSSSWPCCLSFLFELQKSRTKKKWVVYTIYNEIRSNIYTKMIHFRWENNLKLKLGKLKVKKSLI